MRRGGVLGGRGGYQDRGGDLGVAGGGRTAPESEKNDGGRGGCRGRIRRTGGLTGRFLAPGGRGKRGASIGGCGEARGGRKRRIDGEEEAVLRGFLLFSFWLAVEENNEAREACARRKTRAWCRDKEEGKEDHARQVVEAPCFPISASA
jgi:hypothetical protein